MKTAKKQKEVVNFVHKNSFEELRIESQEFEDDHEDYRVQINQVEELNKKKRWGAKQAINKEPRMVNMVPEMKETVCGMMFHLTDAKRMLASVQRIVDAGNKVALGPEEEDNYVQNINTKKKFL